jgi:uncharacterized tellurite resistance protein B-like protein
MTAELARAKLQAIARGCFGLLLVAAATQLRLFPLNLALGIWGAIVMARAATRLIRIQVVEQNMDWYRAYQEFARASLPRQVFLLLLAVAESDGPLGDAEREVVRTFLQQRFSAPIETHEAWSWESARITAGELGALANALRRALSPSERDTVFFWCCQVAFADGRFARIEHQALQAVARAFAIRPSHARVLFHHAKARFSQQQEGAEAGARFRRGGARAGAAAPPQSARERALATLGLDANAGPEQIRRRHRELVKRHHPDAHSHLGPVAAADAARRFREIQAAYEVLTGHGA